MPVETPVQSGARPDGTAERSAVSSVLVSLGDRWQRLQTKSVEESYDGVAFVGVPLRLAGTGGVVPADDQSDGFVGLGNNI